MFSQGEETPIEVWTESELSGMHALWWLCRGGRGGTVAAAGIDASRLRSRLDGAAAWHLEHTQPDNATNRPWALHVFLERWLREGDAESRLYAETLLHNSMAMSGRPEGFCAMIVRDAVGALERMNP